MSADSERRTNTTASPTSLPSSSTEVAAPRVSLSLASGAAHTALILHAGARNAESRSQTTSRQRAYRARKPLQTHTRRASCRRVPR